MSDDGLKSAEKKEAEVSGKEEDQQAASRLWVVKQKGWEIMGVYDIKGLKEMLNKLATDQLYMEWDDYEYYTTLIIDRLKLNHTRCTDAELSHKVVVNYGKTGADDKRDEMVLWWERKINIDPVSGGFQVTPEIVTQAEVLAKILAAA